MSGGAFSLSFSLVLSARLAPFHRLPFTTVRRESLSAPSSLEALCTWLNTGGLTFGDSAFPQNGLAFHQELDEVGKTQVDW